MAHTQKKSRHPGVEPPTLILQGQRPTCWPTLFLVYVDPDWYVPIRTNICLGYSVQKTRTAPVDGSTAEASPRVGIGEQGEARRANNTPNDGPHLDSLSIFGSPFALSFFFVFLSYRLTFSFFFILSTRSRFCLRFFFW